jgi:F-type H+-transporting ATPase subunit b
VKPIARFLSAIFLFGMLAAPAPPLHAQQAPAASKSLAQQAREAVARDEHMDMGQSESSIEEYRHSAIVKLIARFGHVSTETAAQIFEDINSGVLIGAIVIVLWRMLPGLFRRRSEDVSRALTEAQRATEEANRRLTEVEARLMRLDSEIDAIRLQVERDAAEDEKRIHASMEAERERIIASAEQEIASLQAGAQRELKKFAADLAVDQAMHRIQLSADTDRELVKQFRQGLGSETGGKA